MVMIAAFFGSLVALGPSYYFMNQNYEIFSRLALDHAPALVENLQREQQWINATLGYSCVAVLLFFGFLSFRMTNRIVGPIKVLRNHLLALSRGHWHQPNLKIRDNDEFHDLVDSYNYFHGAFKVNLQKDLELLRRLQIDPRNKDAYKAWHGLIDERCAQLGLEKSKVMPATDSAAPNAQSPDARRVS